MTYGILILRRAQKELEQLSSRDYERVKTSILGLGFNPRPHGCLKLSARSGWRIRIGDYRVVYEIDDHDLKVTILTIGHRRGVYK